jgi:hypothetical protein
LGKNGIFKLKIHAMKLLFLIITSLFITVSQAYSQCGTTIIASDLSICTNVPSSVLFSTDAGTYVIYWTNNDTSTGIPASGTGDILNVLPTIPGASLIYIEAIDTLNNCPTLYDTITIVINETPDLAGLPNITACANDIVNVNPFACNPTNNNATYSWTGNNSSIGLSPVGTGNIASFFADNPAMNCQIDSISVIAFANGCSSLPEVFTITVCPVEVVYPSPNITVCNNEITPIINFISPNPSITYFWSNDQIGIGLPLNGTGNINPFTATNSTSICLIANITVLGSANGCVSLADTFSITVCPSPTINLTSDTTICSGNQVILVAQGLPSGGTYLWNTLETNDSITVNSGASTNFGVTYQSADGCTNSDTVSVSIATIDNLNLTDTTICQGSTVILSAGAHSFSCDFAEPICSNSGINFQNIANSTAAPIGNNYECLITQPNPSWFYFEIGQPGDMQLDVQQFSSFSGSGIDVDCILYGPYSSYAEATTFCGNLGTAAFGSGLNTVVACSYSAGSYENIPLNGVQTGQVYILLLLNFSNEQGYYTFSNLPANASLDCSILNNNTSPTSYLWSTGETTPWISVIPNNTNTYSVTATSNGCDFTDSSIVTVIPTPTVSVNNEVIASGQNATLTAIGAPSGGAFNWTPSGQTSSSIVVSPITTTDYTVSYSLNGCSSEAIATVDVVAGMSDQTTHSISVFPNPAQNSLSIQVSEPLIGSAFEIIDQQGRVLKTGEMQSQVQVIAISEIKHGIYTIRIANRNLKFLKN